VSGFVFPEPRIPDAMEAPSLRWGIAGPGWIAERFVESLLRHGSQRVTAVGSRSIERAAAFGAPRGLRAHGSYEELAADPEVDVVYVATPHTAHLDVALAALEAGKHVLVEKPMGINAAQAEAIRAAAAARGLFAAEALWTVFLPRYDVVRQLVRDGRLGAVTQIVADYGEYLPPSHRAYDPALAGGPLLDLGVYLFALATDLAGEATAVTARGATVPGRGGTPVNGRLSALLDFDGGAQAALATTMGGFTPATFTVVGTEATLVMDGPFNGPGGLMVRTTDGAEHRWDGKPGSHVDGLHFQAAAVAWAIAAGRTEVEERPLEKSLRTLRAMDAAREQLGIVYPGEHRVPGGVRLSLT